ncbi:Protein SOF1 [Candida viswanathii]|uniref:Protein SOF1 n=1 Tax=Candida viswanathii TaxID=5486 RepID=A0A367XNU8_9ASCO|nr:Protein SOF1 [Candida viswanathii]
MKIKTISRSSDTYVPVKNTQESSLPRNLNPALHPFERAREYTRALQATKLERMFAQPFLGQLGDGHRDGVYALAKNHGATNQVASASGDGVVKYWNLTDRLETASFKAHYGMVSGVCVHDSRLYTCGDDKTVKVWSVSAEDFDTRVNDDEVYGGSGAGKASGGLIKTFVGEHSFKGIDHHRDEGLFVTGGAAIQLWDINRSKYISNLSWGCDNVNAVKFNQSETNIIASTGSDNSIVLYDIRTNTPVHKAITSLRNNALCFNPMEPFNFVSACDDTNAYSWDMRKMEKPKKVHKGHVAPVMSVDYSPTGQELVTGSWDKTIRIFPVLDGRSRDVYHTKRMQRVSAVMFTMDSKYILSGSEDTSVRVWRARSDQRSAVKSARERAKLEYDEKLKERYQHMPEIKRISKHRHLPKVVKKAEEIRRNSSKNK